MIFWIYIGIAVIVTAVVLAELFTEKDWRKQIALALVLIPLLLRIFLVK